MATSLTINTQRLWDTVMASAEIGAMEGGLRRLTLSEEDRRMRDLFARWVREDGYGLSIDPLGSMFVRRSGMDDSLDPVLIGSHLDTQWAGGRYDGVMGVLAGLEVLRSLDDAGIKTRRPVEVVNWTNEEGARFQPPMMCALAFAGKQTRQWVYDRTDKEGIRFGDALEAIGYIGDAPLGKPLDSYFELHIEQGPQLWETGTKVGIVAGGFPSRGWRVHVHGQNAHAGPTPMAQRSNAIMGASYLSVAVNDIGWRFDPEAGKAGVIRLAPEPNIGGIIPAFAEMLVDMRHPTPAGVTAMAEAFEAAIPRAARDSRTRIEIQESWGFGEFSFDGDLIEHLRTAAGQLGYPTMDLHSQAGHDAYHIADVAPTAMIFTPCDEGLTHTFRESTRLEDQVPGVEVLLNAVAARAA